MDNIISATKEHDDIQKRMVESTREMAIRHLEEEYARARVNLDNTDDLRVLKSFITRICGLNNPRKKIKKVSEK